MKELPHPRPVGQGESRGYVLGASGVTHWIARLGTYQYALRTRTQEANNFQVTGATNLREGKVDVYCRVLFRLAHRSLE